MNILNSHYHQLLGLSSSWEVASVDFSLETSRVEIHLSHIAEDLCCPECGSSSAFHDSNPERQWRHLDTMQFETVLVASVPRSRCKKCGVKSIATSWTSRKSRFTLLFEAFAVAVLQASHSISSACRLLRLSWHTANKILIRAVDRGLKSRKEVEVAYLGIDEKHFHKGQDYVTLLNDVIEGRVLDVVEDRTKESTTTLLNKLSAAQKEKVQAITMDFWSAFISTAKEILPHTEIVHDRFHISQYLNNAVDIVRRAENKKLLKNGDERLLKTKYRWLENIENMTEKNRDIFEQLLGKGLETEKVWELKTFFRDFWERPSVEEAQIFFEGWLKMVYKLDNKRLNKVAKMLERHIDRILTFFIHPINNGVSEGLNCKIQSVKAAARGFGSFESYRRRILFFCGKLDMMPCKLY